MIEAVEHQPRARIALESALRDETRCLTRTSSTGLPARESATRRAEFAAALLAEGADDPADVERRVRSGVHPDITWVEPRGAHDILVDDVRTQIVRQAALRPFEARKRVFVIVDADRMNEESQNALLKTLEEPASFAHFVLVSSAPGRLLPTIPSRCRPVAFGAIPPAQDRRGARGGGRGRGDRARLRPAFRRRPRAGACLAGDQAAMRAEAEAAARAMLS